MLKKDVYSNQLLHMKLAIFFVMMFVFTYIYTKLDRDDDWRKIDGTKTLDFDDALYFSTVSMAAVGYGDIYPSSLRAKRLVQLQLILSFIIFIL